MPKLSPLVSEFESTEAADECHTWFRAKVEESLRDTRPSSPHDEAIYRMLSDYVEITAIVHARRKDR